MARLTDEQLKQLVEAAIFVADEPLSKDKLQTTVLEGLRVSNKKLDAALAELKLDYAPRGIQLIEVSSGFRFQSVDSLSPWLSKLWQEQAPRYSRALLETLSLIAYRQPITRGEIEDVRGVSVSSHIMKTLTEREWVKVVGHKEVPGRPSLYATTKGFLDYFGIKSLADLPPMQTIEVLPELEQKEQDEQRLKTVAEHMTSDTVSQETAINLAELGPNKEQIH
ncbi:MULTISPECIES: SMC-Scp complex subunit ScpB [Aliiglaciecola]|uniref:SMC-Scp complex subunit ScpB n=1 Tax=Aliiglaciecola TaxID=1406885 RepID=UPI001C095B17|nr:MULTISPECIES: SMC-Scp complex subunit ScpB [Aliiglaciecola]MBU2878230.1 SMC-Scp complex subunit ScpB [Aliiglaciecola lipolytica]MDO6711859.1 SMC-Scp complex subunit ScpB [Aliiglaciecola sp. 2_MG-2023]MDO6752967.1 SMC-Scp complex subunit ScpB [Aliiglaciecola sp. 1_MG-2023]